MIGIILSARYLRNKERATNNEHVLFYMKLARKNRVDLCFYSPQTYRHGLNRLQAMFIPTKTTL